MTVLLEQTPLDGLDVTHGALRLTEGLPERITWIAPYPGEAIALSHALQAALSLSFPMPGESRHSDAGRILWSGRSQALLLGPEPPVTLSAHAAVIDQTEGWASMHLAGRQAEDVLARLCPLDLRRDRFGSGTTARSLLGHMNAQITAEEFGFEILVMCSMALSAAHEIELAMRAGAARKMT